MRRSLLGLVAGFTAAGMASGCNGQGSPAHPNVGAAESVGQAMTICPAGATLQGADVSSYQVGVQWNLVAAAGLSFSIAKATEGISIQDSQFAANWTGMKAAGIVRGAYHFFHSLDDGATQADDFLAMVNQSGGFANGDLPPFLDWEITDSGDTAAHAITEAQNFIDEIQAKTGLTTIIYTYPNFWTSTPANGGVGSPSQFGAYPVWYANYATCPNIPSPWTGWLFWQYSSTGTVNGMNCDGACDLDEFNGDLAQLQQIAIGGDGGLILSTGDGGTGLPATVLDQASGNDAVTLVDWTDGHLGLFAKTPGGSEEYSATTGNGDSWSTPSALDTGADCGSAAAFWGASYLYPELYSPLAAGGTGHLWETNGAWNSYQSLGGSGLSHLSTVVWPSGLVEVFALGSDGAAWHDAFDTATVSWVGWASLGGSGFTQGPRPLIWPDGHGELYEVDGSGNVWRATSATGDGSDWTAFAQIGSGIASRLSPVRWPDGTIELFGRGSDGNIWRSATGPAGAGAFPAFSILASQPTVGEPSAFMNPNGGAELVTRDPSGNVIDIAYSVANGSWPASFTSVGEVAASDPFGWIRGDGNAELFAVDGSGNLVHSLRSAGSWSSWAVVGAGFDACAPALAVVDGGMGGSSSGGVSTNSGGGSSSGGTSATSSSSVASSASAGSSSGSSSSRGGSSSGSASTGPLPDAGPNPFAGSGCSCGAGSSPAPLFWIVAALVLLRRRRLPL